MILQVRELAARASAGGVLVSAAAVAAAGADWPAVANRARLRIVTSMTGAAAAAAVAAGEVALVLEEAHVRHAAPLPPAVGALHAVSVTRFVILQSFFGLCIMQSVFALCTAGHVPQPVQCSWCFRRHMCDVLLLPAVLACRSDSWTLPEVA